MNKKHPPSMSPAKSSTVRRFEDMADVTPEQVAQAIFAAARPPDPTKRKQRNKRKRRVVDE